MKRLVTVLAMMLILTLTAWNNAESRRGPNVEFVEIISDHPWGGDQNDPTPPQDYSISTTNGDDLTISSIIKNFNFRYLFNGTTYMFSGFRTIRITTTTTPATETITTTTDSNNNNTTTQSSGGRGM